MTTAIRDQLQSIYDEQGVLTPALVVETARDENHPLHASFEWDDGIVGEKYRHIQAGEMIRCAVIDTTTDDGEQEKVRAFVSVNRVDGPSYVPTKVAATDPFMSALVLQSAEREWKALRRKYSHLAEFMEIVRRDSAA
jgi:hypothetical protein